MTTPANPSKDETFALLRFLDHISDGPAAYYRALASDDDETVRVGAWLQLLTQQAVTDSDWPTIFDLCRYASVRSVAAEYFISMFEYDAALKAIDAANSPTEDIRREGLKAALMLDQAGATNHQRKMYLATGNEKFLVGAAKAAEAQGGWSLAIPWLMRLIAISPTDPDTAGTTILTLSQARQADLLETFLQILERSQLHPEFGAFVLASVASIRGEWTECVRHLEQLPDSRLSADPALRPLTPWAITMRAETYDKLGRFSDSHAEYQRLNSLNRVADMNPDGFYQPVRHRSSFKVPPLPADARNDVVQMLGFPRSGTTLLENGLARHPLVETFEEIPSHSAAISYIMRVLSQQTRVPDTAQAIFVEARKRYYAEIDRRKRNPNARVNVDKMPLQAADAVFMSRLFPDRRFIFSIRHPFDVVLSCFRQQFEPNVAMENFRTIADSVRLYDFVMSQWFSVHGLDDSNVHYVRYEELVTDYKATMARILEFLGVSWDDAVLDFAAEADRRRAKTPSYQKIRQGLSIGVQTYWRNYGFLFQTPEAEPLHKWAKFFGYPTN